MLPGVNAPFGYLARATGASVDELKLISSFLISYPLAALLKRLPANGRWPKNVFIIAVSLAYLVGLFDLWDGVRTILISGVGTYALTYYIDGSLMPWIVFVFLMGHMSVNHIKRHIENDPSVVDVTGAQMVMVMKLSAFAWNVHDGRLNPSLLTDSQKEKAVSTMPSFLDYAGYILFFPALFAGPAFDYADYIRWIDNTIYAGAEATDAKGPVHKQAAPHSGTAAGWKAAYGLGWIFLFLQMSGWYNIPLLLSDQYMQYSLVRRIFILYMLGFTSRLKYYGVWSLTEGACILSGMGYGGIDPRTKKPRWDRLENVNPWGIETAQNSRGYLENWNKNTNNWLRNYIYLRVTPKGQKPGFRASLATFATSAFWHGFEGGYYLTFILGAFIQTVAKNFRRHVRPFFLSPDGTKPTSTKIYYDIASYFATQLGFCFTTAPFVILSLSDSLTVWARVYFYAIIAVGLSTAFFASPGKAELSRRLDARNHPHLRKTLSQEANEMPSLGLPSDPGREIDEAIDEVRQEVETRRRRGSKVVMPTGAELRKAVERKLGRGVSVVQDGMGRKKLVVDGQAGRKDL